MKAVVGLTGGIACGKTTVAQMFAELGVPIIDADDLARQVVEPGTQGLARIVETFGRAVLDERGSLDRKRLGETVFEDAEARAKLNGILHPLIGAAGAERIGSLQTHPGPYIVYEAALLVETGSFKAFAALVVVTANPATQHARLVARDGFSRAEADARIASQLPMAEKVAVADFVIINDGDLAETRAQVAEVHQTLTARFAEREATP